MKQLTIANRSITLFGETKTACPVVWMHTFENEGKDVWEACQDLQTPIFRLVAIQINDWNSALSPWQSSRVFKGDSDLSGNAGVYLRELGMQIIPNVMMQFPPSADLPCDRRLFACRAVCGVFAVPGESVFACCLGIRFLLVSGFSGFCKIT